MRTFSTICLIAVLAVSGIVADCPDGYQLNNNKCYKLYTTTLSKTMATNKCNSDMGYLTSVQNIFENSFVTQLAGNASVSVFWVGLQCVGGSRNSCSWDDGLVFSFDNFSPGNPNQNGDCVSVSTVTFMSGYWQSYSCNNQLAFICEVQPGNGPVVSSCLAGYEEFNGYCYRVFPKSQEQVAEAMCESDCGYLTSIHSDGENNYIQSLATKAYPAETYVRIGLVEYGNTTQWLDGTVYSKMDYSKIGFDMPAFGNCFGLALKDDAALKGYWASLNCDTSLVYVCKTPKGVCNALATTTAPSQCTAPTAYTTTLNKNGTIDSPGYPNKYPPNRCVYIISSPSDTVVQVQFPVFTLDPYSTIELYNDIGDATPFKTLTYADRVATVDVFRSSENQMKIIFLTGTNTPTTGNYRWELLYETSGATTQPTSSPTVCQSPQVFNANYNTNQTVFSPGFPYRYQPNSCVYMITSPINTLVQVEFPVFILDTFSKIDLYNDLSDSTPFKTLTYFSGIRTSDIFSSNGNQMKVIFTAPQNTQNTDNFRWEMIYTAGYNTVVPTSSPLTNGGCNQGVIYAPNTITSPNYPNDYPNQANCQYQLRSRTTTKKLSLTFNPVNVEYFDPITIYDGPSVTYPLLGVLRGKYTTNQTFLSTGYEMYVTFLSDASGTGPGFSAGLIDYNK